MKKIYLLKCENEAYYKIGITKDIEKRINTLQTGNPEKIKIISTYDSPLANKIEKTLHNIYSHLKMNGEWFNFSIKEELEFQEICKTIEKNLIYIEQNKLGF